MQLFYAPLVEETPHCLPPDESAHAVRVLRLGRGAEIAVTDGRGTLIRAVIERPDPECCGVRILSAERNCGRLPYRLTLAVALTRNPERWEWFAEKAVETGVERIVPLDCERGERRRFRADRAERIITAAMKQSIKTFRPQLAPLSTVEQLLGEPAEGARFIAHCSPELPKVYLGDAVTPGSACTVMIGPEGDFSPAETEAALAAGCRAVTLGPHRLRTETAGVAAAVIVSAVNCLAR